MIITDSTYHSKELDKRSLNQKTELILDFLFTRYISLNPIQGKIRKIVVSLQNLLKTTEVHTVIPHVIVVQHKVNQGFRKKNNFTLFGHPTAISHPTLHSHYTMHVNCE